MKGTLLITTSTRGNHRGDGVKSVKISEGGVMRQSSRRPPQRERLSGYTKAHRTVLKPKGQNQQHQLFIALPFPSSLVVLGCQYELLTLRVWVWIVLVFLSLRKWSVNVPCDLNIIIHSPRGRTLFGVHFQGCICFKNTQHTNQCSSISMRRGKWKLQLQPYLVT